MSWYSSSLMKPHSTPERTLAGSAVGFLEGYFEVLASDGKRRDIIELQIFVDVSIVQPFRLGILLNPDHPCGGKITLTAASRREFRRTASRFIVDDPVTHCPLNLV